MTTITLLCPNGHKLVCPETQAGKRGKCPQCGATFRVPDLSSSAVGAAGSASGSGTSMPMISGSGSAPRNAAPVPIPVPVPMPMADSAVPAAQPQPQPAAAPEAVAPAIRPYADGEPVDENEVIFLCPNGHQLCGPTTLSGNAGACPLCGVQFLVPSDEDQTEREPAARSPGGNASPFDFDQQQTAAQAGAQAMVAQGTVDTTEVNNDGNGEANGLMDLFDSFWAYKAHGATIELHLENGQVIAPGGYAPHLSRGSHAVFMMRDANGSHTLAAVRWASISHIAVRGLRQLPEGVFDVD